MSNQSQQGQLIQADFFSHTGGLNITDSPFKVGDGQSILGHDYDYVVTGGFRKRYGNTLLSLDSVQAANGVFVFNNTTGVKTLLRSTSSVLQTVDQNLGTTTLVTDDSSSTSTSIFSSSVPVCFSQFNAPGGSLVAIAGGGQASGQLGGYNGTDYTTNGSVAPASGSLSLSGSGSSGTLPAGSYYISIGFVKTSTGALSNASIDTLVTITTSQSILITFSNITNPDTTKYSHVTLYRSDATPTGVKGFTVGSVIATVPWATGFYLDSGTNQDESDLVPRVGNTSLDNTPLPAGTYNSVTTWKQHLVTASGSTLYFSDINKPESWPISNYINVPSGGNITALAVISFSTPTTSSVDEFVVVFKERECWVVTGSTFITLTDTSGNVIAQADISLLFIDYVGTKQQNLVVYANGFLYWVDHRGFYAWDGSYKPVYISRLIEFDFGPNGDLSLPNLQYGTGAFFRSNNQIVWFLSSNTKGVQQVVYKLDLRLTLVSMATALAGRVLDGIFMKDSLSYNIYGCYSLIRSDKEVFYGVGNDGNIWELYQNVNSDNGSAIPFSYRTRPHDFGSIGTAKRYHKVIVWCSSSTTNNLTLNYWTGYSNTPNLENTKQLQIANQVNQSTYWDVSYWDVSYFDQQYISYVPVIFNLSSVEGDSLTLEFQQQSTNSPVTVAGYSVIYSTVGLRK